MSPIFEDLGVFKRLGESTDVVTEEMFDFFDKGDPPQHLALRPELTASVCRAFAEHRPTPPCRLRPHAFTVSSTITPRPVVSTPSRPCATGPLGPRISATAARVPAASGRARRLRRPGGAGRVR